MTNSSTLCDPNDGCAPVKVLREHANGADARLTAVEDSNLYAHRRIDELKTWIMTTAIASVGTLIAVLSLLVAILRGQ